MQRNMNKYNWQRRKNTCGYGTNLEIFPGNLCIWREIFVNLRVIKMDIFFLQKIQKMCNIFEWNFEHIPGIYCIIFQPRVLPKLLNATHRCTAWLPNCNRIPSFHFYHQYIQNLYDNGYICSLCCIQFRWWWSHCVL